VVFVALEHRVDAIEQQVLPFEVIARQDRLDSRGGEPAHIPGAMGFHIRLIDDIEAVLIAEPVEA